MIVKKSEAIKNLKKKASENLHTPTGGKKSLTLAETPKSVKVDIQALVLPLWAPLCLL